MKSDNTQGTTSSLNRWCLRALHQSCDSMLYNAIHAQNGSEPLAYVRHKGPPPLPFSCIAPHCQEWKCIDDNTGYCCYRKNLKAASALISQQEVVQTQHMAAPQPSKNSSTLQA